DDEPLEPAERAREAGARHVAERPLERALYIGGRSTEAEVTDEGAWLSRGDLPNEAGLADAGRPGDREHAVAAPDPPIDERELVRAPDQIAHGRRDELRGFESSVPPRLGRPWTRRPPRGRGAVLGRRVATRASVRTDCGSPRFAERHGRCWRPSSSRA